MASVKKTAAFTQKPSILFFKKNESMLNSLPFHILSYVFEKKLGCNIYCEKEEKQNNISFLHIIIFVKHNS